MSHSKAELRRSIVLPAGTRDAVAREDALRFLTELHDVPGPARRLRRRLRELAEEPSVTR